MHEQIIPFFSLSTSLLIKSNSDIPVHDYNVLNYFSLKKVIPFVYTVHIICVDEIPHEISHHSDFHLIIL